MDSKSGAVADSSPTAVPGSDASPGGSGLPGRDGPREGGTPPDGEPPQEGAPPGGGVLLPLPGRRALTVWFAVFTLYAVGEIFTGHADGTWGAWACGGYALAAILLLVTRNWLAPLAAAVAGAFLAPLAWMILKVPETSTAEVVVLNRSADYLAKHGTPYLPASLITDWQHYNPYLPLMELFSLPREAGLPGLLGDPRIWTSLVTVLALIAAFAVMSSGEDRRRRVAVLTAVCVSSPLAAFQLTVGVTDPPLIALTCLAIALAGRGQFLRAALVLAVACAMKPTVWAVIPVLAVMAWFRASHRTAVRFTGTVAGAAVVLALAAAPNALATPDAIRQNLIEYPLGISKYKTVAASPLPGHLIAQLGHTGKLAVDALLLLTVIAFAAWLLVRPPRDIRDATIRLIVGYTAVFTIDSSSRFGYYAYPLALLGWLALARSKSAASPPERLAGPPPAPTDRQPGGT
ncbi:MAG TPA: glycosyltransferase 87 family protein [Trebonia sp.]|nr:glycosyltransferase 87 family protein [Trebonia sp.]